MANEPDLSWPADRMAKFIDVTPRRLRQMVQEGIVPRTEKGRYNPFAVNLAYIRWLRDQRGSLNGADDAEDAAANRQARETRRERQLIDLENTRIDNLKKKGLFILRTDYTDGIKDLSTHTRTTIERATFLTKDQRRRLIEEMRLLKPANPEIVKP